MLIDILHLLLSIISLAILNDIDECLPIIGSMLVVENIILIVLGILKLILIPLVIIILVHFQTVFSHLEQRQRIEFQLPEIKDRNIVNIDFPL